MPHMNRSRPTTTTARRPRRVSPSRRPGLQANRAAAGGFRPAIRRRQPQPSGLKGLVSKASHAMPGMMSAKTMSKAGSSARKPAGMALLAGAAGLAFKNREKLGGMLGRGKSGGDTPETATTPSAPAMDAQAPPTSAPGMGTQMPR